MCANINIEIESVCIVNIIAKGVLFLFFRVQRNTFFRNLPESIVQTNITIVQIDFLAFLDDFFIVLDDISLFFQYNYRTLHPKTHTNHVIHPHNTYHYHTLGTDFRTVSRGQKLDAQVTQWTAGSDRTRPPGIGLLPRR